MIPRPTLPVDGVTCHAKSKICMILHECVGPTQNNGLGAAYCLLAETLTAAGHPVTILYTTTKCERETLSYWRKFYLEKRIDFVVLPETSDILIAAADWLAGPYRVYCWLRGRNFDVIHYPEYPGNGYFIALAKHQGLAFANTLLCMGTHGPSMWSREANGYEINSVRHLGMDFLERQTASMSDVVISPSQTMVQWLYQQEWKLPARTYVQQNIQSPYALSLRPAANAAKQRFDEIVYFGRIEPRKGYKILCDAIDQLPKELQDKIRVTFLGSSAQLYAGDAADEVRQRAINWSCPVQILSNKTHQEALDYLASHACLAVMPSHDEVMGYAVMECIGAGIPFIASRAGGIPELIAARDIDRVCFFPVDASSLAKKLVDALRNGLETAKPAIPYTDNQKCWTGWHSQIDTTFEPASDIHADMHEVDCIVVPPEAAAINTLVHQGKNPYVFISTYGDQSVADHLSTLLRVAGHTQAAIVTSAFRIADVNYIFAGPALFPGVFANVFGTLNALIRRDVFVALGGFKNMSNGAEFTHDFFLRAVAKGYTLEAIPEILFRRKVATKGTDQPYDAVRLGPYAGLLPASMRKMIFPTDAGQAMR